ncbi:MAG: septum formation protein Maf [Deltaproteobacteria bacterium RIFCSPLOWO2_02_FULL_46_8]|nr:MAG: septum formation protein Maf [Deltaproteobacteria bacterium RIFCSPLOWO2_02_FULL_46_8]
MKLYLASTSPRRYELLSTLNIPFEVIPPTFEEKQTLLPADEEALYFSEQKAKSVAPLCPNALILASDTLIDCEGAKLGKPNDPEEARRMLRLLSGKTHFLYTAVVLFNTQDQSLKKHLEKVEVTFHTLSDTEIQDYVVSGESLGKAGAYAIQGKGSVLIEKIAGDRDAVIGLPLEPIRRWLKNVSISDIFTDNR